MSAALRVLFLYDAPVALREHLAAALGDVAIDWQFATADHPLDDPALLEQAAEADVLIGWRPTAELLAHARRAKLFQLPWAGVGPLLPAFIEANLLRAAHGLPPIPLANNHGVCPATAQHAVAMLLALTNQLVQHHQWMKAGQWRLGDNAARSVALRDDVTIGLLGYGAINKHVHRLLAPFGTRFTALKREWTNDESGLVPELRFTTEQLPEFLCKSDILVIAVPHTPLTDGLLGARELALLGTDSELRSSARIGEPLAASAAGSGAVAESGDQPLGGLPLLVNVARGGVVDEAALYFALRDGVLAGAALDVWYDYQPTPDAEGKRRPWKDSVEHPFHELQNVLLSPHRAASPLDDLRRWDPIIDNLRRLARGESPQSLVDLAAGY